MSQGQGGLDPRITGPASVAQAQASSRRPGIPLISDEEALRRQQAADRARRRRQVVRRVGGIAIAVLVAIALLLAVSAD